MVALESDIPIQGGEILFSNVGIVTTQSIDWMAFAL